MIARTRAIDCTGRQVKETVRQRVRGSRSGREWSDGYIRSKGFKIEWRELDGKIDRIKKN